jgi:hypothetical protein
MSMHALTPARRERLVRFGSWFVLLAALLPNDSYMGHWPIAGAGVHLDPGVDPASVIAETRPIATSAPPTAAAARA